MIGAFIALTPIRVTPRVGALAAAVLAWFSFTPTPSAPAEVFLLTAIAAAVLLLAASGHRWLRDPVLQLFGLVSYGLYLWHMVILRLGLPGPVSLAMSLAVAYASYVLIELPALRWRQGPRSPSSRA